MFNVGGLWKPNPRDIKSNLVTTFSEVVQATATSLVVSVPHSKVPTDRILIVDSWSIVATPYAVAKVDTFQFLVNDSMNTTFVIEEVIAQVQNLVAGNPNGANISKEHHFNPGDVLTALAHFVVGASPNSIVSYLRGHLIPRGSFTQ